MKAFKQLICGVIIFITIPMMVQAQNGDTSLRRNIIKVDLTSYWLYRNALMFSYERVVKNRPNQTWAVTAGLQQFPKLLGSLADTLAVTNEFKSKGWKIGGDYRFYLKKENKFGAPHGVYIGPYTTYHHYFNSRTIEVNNNGTIESGNLDFDLNILNLGVQLGYQFVLNNRWTIDMVFIGPSVSHYAFKTKLDGDISVNPDDITNEVILALMDKYPGFKQFLNDKEFASKGKVDSWAFGYRYQLQVGYHFGRKKK